MNAIIFGTRKKLPTKGSPGCRQIQKSLCLQFYIQKKFQLISEIRSLSVKPHQSRRLSGFGKPVIRQDCRKFLQFNEGFIKQLKTIKYKPVFNMVRDEANQQFFLKKQSS
ncbi:hypothetical protein [Peribacillus frigoritolerans]|uniref:hypothetical protein n=1 Tax=Peribacillus frigoritolerans TaxID=450367 RepID=UPI00227E79A3|nr:hypothetical protein [Peribacillus frigoritolerans]MCY9140193.1 hypothetical protein [Peribacillus frigoritolerans]